MAEKKVLMELSSVLHEKADTLKRIASSSSSSPPVSPDRSQLNVLSRNEGESRLRLKCICNSARNYLNCLLCSDYLSILCSTHNEHADILQRADKLQKSLKRFHSTKLNKVPDDQVLITVCEMTETRTGTFRRKAKARFIEIEAQRSDIYNVFAEKAAIALHMSPLPMAKLTLFKVNNGAAISSEPVSIKGKKKPWTLGNYLLLLKKNPVNVKIGCGYMFEEPSSDESSTDGYSSENLDRQGTSQSNPMMTKTKMKDPKPADKQLKQSLMMISDANMDFEPSEAESICSVTQSEEFKMENIDVKYSLKSVEIPRKLTAPKDRLTIWVGKGRNKGEIGAYQPEEDGYEVASIIKGGLSLVSPFVNVEGEIIGWVVNTSLIKDRTGFNVVDQSPTLIEVESMEGAVMLYCISSAHGSCAYVWRKLESVSVQFASSPVVYVVKPGHYECTVTLAEKKILSNIVSVQLLQKYISPAQSLSVDSEIDVPTLDHEEIIEQSTFSQSANIISCISNPTSVLEFFDDELSASSVNRELLGKGGYGTVYKGYLRSTHVALKYLTEEGEKALYAFNRSTFKTEIAALSKFRHRNLVDLMGYCLQPPCLVYEFLEKGSLYSCLHQEKEALDWHKRSKILKGACRGLAWLHSNKPPLVHQDIKSANVLIDSAYTAKLGDFGFSLEMPEINPKRTLVTSPFLAFTQGYTAPEVTEGSYSPKSDVYSYGVVVLETYTGALAYNEKREDKRIVEHFDDQLETLQSFQQIPDKLAGDPEHYLAQIFFKIVKSCIIKHSRRCDSAEIMRIWEETNY